MPRYNKKITSLMDYEEFKDKIQGLDQKKQAFLTVLFFAGCRVSEALAIEAKDIVCKIGTLYIQIHRLKGSKQTDPTEIPRADALRWVCEWLADHAIGHTESDRIFDFSRSTAYRTVKKVFPSLYPHYFRMNRITKTADQFGDSTVYHLFGITASSIDHYRGKVDIKRVGEALRKEIEKRKEG